ncbi:DNA repair protein NreA [Natronomonas sp.]|uniref:DNA repair protein NreA n=1 Tax=Natronomonas sp. TaxID=2184060 RepID=UPI0026094B0E|nr:DNA repair protein NreA [Natronomonas sp.]
MRLDEYVDGLDRDESVELRRLAEEKSYAVTEHIDDARTRFDETLSGGTMVGSTAPSVFVGRSSYPNVSAGLLAPVGDESDAADYVTTAEWYRQGYSIDDVFRRRTGLLNSTRRSNVDAHDVWDGFVGTQREVAIADRPVDIELDLGGRPGFDLDGSLEDIAAPRGPRASADSASVTENPSVPRAIEKTLSDDEWRAEGAIAYLYRRGFDVYEINNVLSVGALGKAERRRLVPTRWSITAVDDTVGQYLRGSVRNAPSIDRTLVWHNSYMGNEYWVIAAPGDWEFELLELKAPGSIWNPDPGGRLYMAADSEGRGGRSDYVDETSGAYYAARLGVLEELADRGRQATVFVIRHATEGYWAPVGVWQVRESVRNAFEGDPAVAETFHGALRELVPRLPVSMAALRRKSTLAAGIQSDLSAFGAGVGADGR